MRHGICWGLRSALAGHVLNSTEPAHECSGTPQVAQLADRTVHWRALQLQPAVGGGGSRLQLGRSFLDARSPVLRLLELQVDAAGVQAISKIPEGAIASSLGG